MLPERFGELLTAYVDGELGARQRKHVLRLLRRSAEARAQLRQMQEAAKALRSLPRRHLDRDLSDMVVQTIVQRKLHPHRRRHTPPPYQIPAWSGLAAAAAVLLVIGVASYMYFAHSLPVDTIAKNDPSAKPAKDDAKQPADDSAVAEAPKENWNPAEEPKRDRPAEPPSVVAEKPRDKTSLPGAEPAPAPADDMKLASPVPTMEMFKPKTAGAPLALILRMAELDQEKAKQELRANVQKDKAYRLELPCRETGRAFDRLQGALKANSFAVSVEQTAHARHSQPRYKTDYVFYAEDLTPEELTAVLQRLAADDKAAEAKRKGDGVFDSVVLSQMTKADHEELSKLLGVDPTHLQVPKSTAPLGVDPRKPLSESTAGQVTQNLTGQGGPPRPEPGKPAVKGPEHQALAMTFNPVRPKAGSVEVKHFLDSRKPARAGTVQVLLVLRGT